MIMYGKENPIVYTPEEVFNPTTANMVLQSMGAYANALRQDYKDAQDKEEQFMKEFGSFMSPIEADQRAYYDSTIGGIGRLYDAAAAQGVDLLRSQQGRSIILRYIMSRPYADLANMRKSAEAATQYRQLLAKGVADGTLDYDTAIKLDGDISTWNTLEKGMWDKVAPSSQRSINEVLAPYIEDLLKSGYEYDAEASKKKPGYRVHTVSDQKIKDQLGKAAADIMRDPMMKLRVKESGLTPEEFIQSELYKHMRTQLSPKEEVDQYYKSRYESNLAEAAQRRSQDRQWAHEDEKAAKAHEYKMAEIAARYGKGSGKPGSGGAGQQDGGYSVSYHMYNQANENAGSTDNSVTARAIELTNKKFKKYLKNGKLPQSIINSKAYQDALLKNERYVRSKDQYAKTSSYTKQHGNYGHSSEALATSVDEKAMLTYPGIGGVTGVAKRDSNGNFTGSITASKGTLFSIQEVSARRGDLVSKTTGKQLKASGNTQDKIVKLQGGGKNFIQQIESDGRTHWYFKTSGGWYHVGIYEESQAMSSMDQAFLKASGQNTKSISTAFPTDGDYFDPLSPYYMQQLTEE